jgi:hypothetical protein
MIKHEDGSVTLTKEEVDWLNDNFQGGEHRVCPSASGYRYVIVDNEHDECGWGILKGDNATRHKIFMDQFTELSE